MCLQNKSYKNTVGKGEIALNPFPNKPCFLCVCSTSLLKTLWEKEKLLITSNFSFSYIIFYLFEELSAILIIFKIVVCKLYQFGKVLKLSFGKGLTSNFSFSHCVFYPFGELTSNSKWLSADSFSLEESKICHLRKG